MRRSIKQSFSLFGVPVSVISFRDHIILLYEHLSVQRKTSRERSYLTVLNLVKTYRVKYSKFLVEELT
jgi:hypothetical protein